MKTKDGKIGEVISKRIKGLLRVEVQTQSFDFDDIELRIISSADRVESISLGIIGKKPCLSFTEDKLFTLYEVLKDYFKITGRIKNEY